MKKYLLWLAAALAAPLFAALPSSAAEPLPWQHNLQPAATPVMEHIISFHNLLLYTITAITIFVFALMFFIMVRFRAKANPVPSKTTHNAMLEVIWTVIPIVILVVIAVPSIKLLYYADRVENPDMTIKVTGLQWYWNYTYPDHAELAYDSRMIADKDIDPAKGQKRLLSVDNPLVIPVETNVQLLITAGPDDVLHSFAVPSFGVKLDAVPGRLNETWTRVTKEGTYYGQCSELCGKGHAYMPIEVRAVSKADFDAWIAAAQKEFISYDDFKAQQGKLAKAEGLE